MSREISGTRDRAAQRALRIAFGEIAVNWADLPDSSASESATVDADLGELCGEGESVRVPGLCCAAAPVITREAMGAVLAVCGPAEPTESCEPARTRLAPGTAAATVLAMSIWEITGTVLGVIGVWLMIRQNIWGWPVGLVQVAVYAWVFFGAKLYSDALLQIAFFLIQAYGWAHWLRGGHEAAHSTAPVTRLTAGALATWVGVGALATAGWGAIMHRTTDAALPYWDAFILVFSLIAQWWQARKHLENWPAWVVINTVAIGVYWAKDLRLTSGLYFVFWLMAVWGWRAWRASLPVGALAPKRPEEDRGGQRSLP